MFDAERCRLSSSERLLRLFREGFSVMDVAEPLLSVDEADKPFGGAGTDAP